MHMHKWLLGDEKTCSVKPNSRRTWNLQKVPPRSTACVGMRQCSHSELREIQRLGIWRCHESKSLISSII